jgi:outer membrane protein, multidrug efflux system
VLPFGGAASTAAPASPTSGARSTSTGRSAADATPATTPGGPASADSSGPAGPTNPLGEGGLPGVTTNIYQVGFDASWEIDLFGGKRRAVESASAQVQAVEEAEHGALISLLGEVAQTYLQLRSGQQRLELARQNIAAAQETLEIIQAKFKTGFATDVEVARQTAEVANLNAAVPGLETAQRLSIHALSVLVGEEPNALNDELTATQPLPTMPAEVPIGLPSDLLRRRPDIRSAERELAAASANIGVATSDLFPKFDLAAAIGLDSSKPADLPKWSSHYYSFTPGIRWPILDWGRARNGLQLTDESEKEALTHYQAVVSQAVLEVEDALVRFRGEQVARASRADALAASREAFTSARQRYAHGLIDSLVVLDAQRSLLLSEDALAQSDAAMRLNLVALYKALGGGWEG